MILFFFFFLFTVKANRLVSSFFQALCALGYCIAPLDVAALVSYFVHVIWVRIPLAIGAWAWCIWG